MLITAWQPVTVSDKWGIIDQLMGKRAGETKEVSVVGRNPQVLQWSCF